MKHLSQEYQEHHSRLEVLLKKKHKLTTYIAEVDGAPAPELPRVQSINIQTLLASTPGPSSATSGTTAANITSSPANASSAKSPTQPQAASATAKSSVKETFSGLIPSPIVEIERAIAVVKMVYDFEGAPSTHEMSVKAGTTLEVLEQQTDGWWRCRDGPREGYVPGYFFIWFVNQILTIILTPLILLEFKGITQSLFNSSLVNWCSAKHFNKQMSRLKFE